MPSSYDVLQASAAYPLVFLMIDSTDHISPKAGLTPTVAISKNGGAFGAPAGAVAEIANGWYRVAGNATDTATLGPLLLHATATGADPTDCLYPVVAFNPQSSSNLGLSALPTAAPAATGGLPTVGTGSGQINAAAGKVPVTLLSTDVSGKIAATLLSTDVTGKIAATLASTDVTGNVACDVQTIKTQAVACAAGVTVNVNLGTTQPVNFTGTAAAALVKSDMQDIAGAAVATGTAQLGVNVVNIKGTASAGAAGYVGMDWAQLTNKTTANALTATTISISQAVTISGNVTVGGYASGQDPATLVLDVAISGHNTPGTVGGGIATGGSSGGSSSDPWAKVLPGAYTTGMAGYIVGTFLDQAISAASTLDFTQAIALPRDLTAVPVGAITVADALWAAVCAATGVELVIGTNYYVKTPMGETILRVFTLDSSSAPTSRS